jgi:hypothetical protein
MLEWVERCLSGELRLSGSLLPCVWRGSSVGGVPTGAVETTALPGKSLRIGVTKKNFVPGLIIPGLNGAHGGNASVTAGKQAISLSFFLLRLYV